jgi:hypothetical protein
MKNIWYVVNIALVGFALLFGYYSSSPENLRHANPDAIFCGAVLLTMPVFAIFSVHYSMRRWTHGRLARPSLSRKIGNWKQDPLQRLFLAMWGAAFMAIGAAPECRLRRHPEYKPFDGRLRRGADCHPLKNEDKPARLRKRTHLFSHPS